MKSWKVGSLSLCWCLLAAYSFPTEAQTTGGVYQSVSTTLAFGNSLPGGHVDSPPTFADFVAHCEANIQHSSGARECRITPEGQGGGTGITGPVWTGASGGPPGTTGYWNYTVWFQHRAAGTTGSGGWSSSSGHNYRSWASDQGPQECSSGEAWDDTRKACVDLAEVDAECVARDGARFLSFGASLADLPRQVCQQGCKAGRIAANSLGGQGYATYEFFRSGDAEQLSCTASTQLPEPVTDWEERGPGQAEQCVSASGLNMCGQASNSSCGYVNDTWVCLQNVGSTECVALPDGSRMCGQAAQAPVVPDNGTPGQKATPDETVQNTTAEGPTTPETERAHDWFSASTVAGSSRAPEGGKTASETYQAGSGGTGGTGDGDGEGGKCWGGFETLCEIWDWLTDTGDPDEHPELPTEEFDVATDGVEWSSGYDIGTCPADRSISLWGGQSITYSYAIACDVAGWFRAILLLSMAFVCGGILLGVRSI